jgi:hypothetical protein
MVFLLVYLSVYAQFMRIVGALGLIFALVFVLVVTTSVVDLQFSTAALTSGPVATAATTIAHFWYILVAVLAAILLIGVFTRVFR